MKTVDNYSIGQRVKMIDDDTNEIVFGTVVEKALTEIVIEWDDIIGPCRHCSEEFGEIT